jgi:hypothetical protein
VVMAVVKVVWGGRLPKGGLLPLRRLIAMINLFYFLLYFNKISLNVIPFNVIFPTLYYKISFLM